MVRSALEPRAAALGKGPRRAALLVPAASVVCGSALALLPVVTDTGWVPDLGFLALIAWRLLRADAWPAWWAAPLGLLNDLLAGSPPGQSVALWSLAMLLLDLADRRTLWRDYWVEWLLAALLIALSEAFEALVAGWERAHLPPTGMLAPLLVSIIAFPLVAGIVGTLDRWRLGR